MEFDHIAGRKKYNIGFITLFAEKKLMSEIRKCQLVCANCHKNRTFQRKFVLP